MSCPNFCFIQLCRNTTWNGLSWLGRGLKVHLFAAPAVGQLPLSQLLQAQSSRSLWILTTAQACLQFLCAALQVLPVPLLKMFLFSLYSPAPYFECCSSKYPRVWRVGSTGFCILVWCQPTKHMSLLKWKNLFWFLFFWKISSWTGDKTFL